MKVECGNCGKVWDEAELTRVFPDIPDLAERIAPGEPVPAGECPDCGALVHEVQGTFRCRACGQVVKAADIREHLIEHNPNAEGIDWQDVRNQFEFVTTPDGQQKRVVISVRGGVAEVAYCPRGITVEIRDYDSDGGDEDELEEDGAWVGTFEGEDD